MPEKKQIPLRLSEKLYNELAAWAEEDFRSVNGQIEYILTECVKQHKKSGRMVRKSSSLIQHVFGICIPSTASSLIFCFLIIYQA